LPEENATTPPARLSCGTAELERAGALKHLRLQEHFCADALVEHGKGQQRGADGIRRDHARCGVDIGRADGEELFGHGGMLSRPMKAGQDTSARGSFLI